MFDYDIYVMCLEVNWIKLCLVVLGCGMIYDCNGWLLVENVFVFWFDIILDKVKDMDVILVGLVMILDLSLEDIEIFNKLCKVCCSFLLVMLKLCVIDEEMVCFVVDCWWFLGVELELYLIWCYFYGDLFVYIIGYVGCVDDKDLEMLGEGNVVLIYIGKFGLECYYEV